MIKIDGEKIIKLPESGKLSDGRWVSGYDKLSSEILQSEGWIEEVNVVPEYDSVTQSLEVDYIETQTEVTSQDDDGIDIVNVVVATVYYKAVNNPPTQEELLELWLTEVGAL